jgi:hypothetical protein
MAYKQGTQGKQSIGLVQEPRLDITIKNVPHYELHLTGYSGNLNATLIDRKNVKSLCTGKTIEMNYKLDAIKDVLSPDVHKWKKNDIDTAWFLLEIPSGDLEMLQKAAEEYVNNQC